MHNTTNWSDGDYFLKSADPLFDKLINKYAPCTLRPIAPTDYYITLVKGILSQQVSSEVSQNFFNSFTNIFGQTPTPRDLIKASIEQIQSSGCSTDKVTYIKDLSQSIIDEKITLKHFDTMEDSAIIKQLTSVKGFGRWTAEIFLILALNRPNILPADDFGLKKSMQILLNLSSIPQKRSQITKLAEPWSPWRSLATWYLWQYYADTTKT